MHYQEPSTTNTLDAYCTYLLESRMLVSCLPLIHALHALDTQHHGNTMYTMEGVSDLFLNYYIESGEITMHEGGQRYHGEGHTCSWISLTLPGRMPRFFTTNSDSTAGSPPSG